MHNEFSDLFVGIGCLEATFLTTAKRRKQAIPGAAEMHGIHTTKTMKRKARTTAVETKNPLGVDGKSRMMQ